MSREDAKAEILKKYPWNMKIVYQDDTYEVTNLMEEKVNSLLDEIYLGVCVKFLGCQSILNIRN